MFPLFTTRCLHVHHDVRDPSGGSGNCGRECCPVILPKWLPRHFGIFYMQQIYDMGPTALLPLRRKACWGFFLPLKFRRLRPGLNPRTWVLKVSTLPLDHWIVIYSYNKTNEMHYFSSFFLIKNSTCFRQINCPSSGVSKLLPVC